MATKVEFLDPQRVRVETANGDSLILGYSDSLNYQINERFKGLFLKEVALLFEEYYDGSLDSVNGAILAGMYKANFNSFLWVMFDKNKERERVGKRIREIRKARNMDAKELAQKIGIDAGNLSRIEQGRFSVGLDILCKIAGVLGMSVDFVPVKK